MHANLLNALHRVSKSIRFKDQLWHQFYWSKITNKYGIKLASTYKSTNYEGRVKECCRLWKGKQVYLKISHILDKSTPNRANSSKLARFNSDTP